MMFCGNIWHGSIHLSNTSAKNRNTKLTMLRYGLEPAVYWWEHDLVVLGQSFKSPHFLTPSSLCLLHRFKSLFLLNFWRDQRLPLWGHGFSVSFICLFQGLRHCCQWQMSLVWSEKTQEYLLRHMYPLREISVMEELFHTSCLRL